MSREIVYLSPIYAGSIHDKKICDLEGLSFSKKTLLMADLGFLGLTSEMAQIVIPHKHKKNQRLTDEQEQWNGWVSKIRVKIEHVIVSIKIFRKVKETFKGRLFAREDIVILIACGLHNLELKVKYAI
ncbi:MAG: transposase family protein [Bacteroidia bacterium]